MAFGAAAIAGAGPRRRGRQAASDGAPRLSATSRMVRLSRISQLPSTRAAATMWPWFTARSCTTHQPQVGSRHAGFAERHVFRDGVVLAIAGAGAEGRKRRRPDVRRAELLKIAHRPDRQVDRPVDGADSGAAAAGARGVDDGVELGGGGAGRARPGRGSLPGSAVPAASAAAASASARHNGLSLSAIVSPNGPLADGGAGCGRGQIARLQGWRARAGPGGRAIGTSAGGSRAVGCGTGGRPRQRRRRRTG